MPAEVSTANTHGEARVWQLLRHDLRSAEGTDATAIGNHGGANPNYDVLRIPITSRTDYSGGQRIRRRPHINACNEKGVFSRHSNASQVSFIVHSSSGS